ncbi:MULTISPECIES: RagB/SusD family nutrient uptake outer membrane protein [Niastella]|uniref:RagB/SusD family nutrient uptake outer membrane protein n=1 Tax=Niastella soli TaxID=2821487 RepID=A0ABS3YSW1_9BACT|nr:RagB/SusD family nutrient uptake outer membrane protein [Niastella soli]MBO9200970.1 RagB/SusD family nutrient uptake outer membrane protein [Niastella soli]
MKVKNICGCLFILYLGIISCNKKEFLDEKPNSNVVVPTTLDDFQQLLDNEVLLGLTPALGELSADNFYIMPGYWQLLSKKEKNGYIWAADIYEGEGKVTDWNTPYEQVLYANVVLDGLKNVDITPDNQQQWNFLKGSALFIRAYAFYNLAQIFALPYRAETATSDLGIPLKLTPNVDEVIKRSTLEETYSQILNDLSAAKDLLPIPVTSYLNRPNKPAVNALLARVYLTMRKFDEAGAAADNCLQLFNGIIDYNIKDPSAPRPFERNNVETMYQSRFVETNVVKPSSTCIVDTNLYSLYAPNDLRRTLFFTVNSAGRVNFKGGYNSTSFGFTGLATDEMYLTRAECRARAGDVINAMNDLNTLLKQRWKTGTFVPYTATTKEEALIKILIERRKEMPLRGIRWTDIRRLNVGNANIVPKRILNNRLDSLPVNSPLYALPIPPDAILMGHYEQNVR